MAKIRRITVSQIEGNGANVDNDDEIRPFGEVGFFVNGDGNSDKLELLMFDGVRTHLKSKVLGNGILYGSNADSGDGAGLDTIKLIPDTALYRNGGNYGNDQYIIIDPTVPNHIHIRAGGEIDDSSAQLILGGEKNSVIVSDGLDSVIVTTDAGENGVSAWSFNSNGSLSFPDNSIQATAWNPDNVDWAAIIGVTIQANGLPVGTRFTQPVPTTSQGAVGDTIGSVTFDSNYIYYCIANYVATTFSTTIGSPGLSIDTIPVVKGSYGTPTTDWTVTFAGVEYVITNVEDGGTTWVLTTPGQNQTGGTGIPVTLFNGTGPINIWKRVAWSNDTW